jgi:hypothetical protein
VTVTVDRSVKQGHLGPAFAGLSYEKTHLTDQYLTGKNAPLIALFRLLGQSMLRLGGNAVDLTTWQPSAQPVGPGMISKQIGTVDVDDLADFANATGWTILYGVNLGSSTPSAAADEAKYAAGKLGDRLYGFEIGNEIGKFGSYATVKAKWESFASAMRAAVPNAQLTGPAVYESINTWVVPFAKDEASNIVLLTDHYYLGSPGGASISGLLADTKLLPQAQQMEVAAAPNHIRDSWRFSECNSYFDHGTTGVSDTLASALWSIDFMLTGAQNGASGVNFHGGGPGQDLSHLQDFPYTPIAEALSAVTGARPLFYGMLLVAQAGTGDMFSAKVTGGDLSAYAVAQADGSTNVALVNKDGTKDAEVSLDIGAPVQGSCAEYLLGSSLTATTVTLAGASISPTGAWSPQPPYTVTAEGNTITVTMPAGSAALVHVR